MITIKPLGGLTNRMRTIHSAASMAMDFGVPLEVVWHRNQLLGCRFDDLFETIEPIRAVHEVDLLTRRGRAVRRLRRLAGLERQPDFTWEEFETLRLSGFDFSELGNTADLYIAAFEEFYGRDLPLMPFTPVTPLRERIEREVSGFRHTVGVHVRRTDHAEAIENSPLELFVVRMNEEIRATPEVTFFVATDDPAVEEALESAFAGRILIHRKRSLDRGCREAIEDAAVDLYCLSRTRKLFGSYRSSFSDIAARMGRIPIETVHTGGPA